MTAASISPRERSLLLRRLSVDLKNEMSLEGSLGRFAQRASGALRVCAFDLQTRVASGMTLADAMDEDARNFPHSTISLVRAGSLSGDLWKAISDAAEFEGLFLASNKSRLFSWLPLR